MLKFRLFFILSCYCVLVQSQTISGVIVDGENKALEGVNIFIQELQKGTVTDVNGEFQLTQLPKKNFQLQEEVR